VALDLQPLFSPSTASSLVSCLDGLDAMFSSQNYKNWLRAQDRATQEQSGVARGFVNDVHFTSFLAEIAEFFDPALVLLRIADSDVPNVSKMVPGSANVKSRMQEMVDREEDYKKDLWQACFDHYVTLEKDLLHPIHYAAYICDPEFLLQKQLTMPQCMTAFNELCEKIFPGDAVMQTNAGMGLSAFKHGDGLTACTTKRLQNLQRVKCLGTDGRKCSLAGTKISSARSRPSLHSSPPPPPPSATTRTAAAMCNTKARNNLKSATTDKVLYVSCNSRLEDKTTSILYREPHMQWMEAPDGANGVAITKQKKDVQVSCMLVP
jgi:hypothetical protein